MKNFLPLRYFLDTAYASELERVTPSAVPIKVRITDILKDE